MKKLNKKGFTLIELIVVIAILAILAAILIPSLTNYIKKATDTKNAANCRSLYTELTLDAATNAPGTISDYTANTTVLPGASVTSTGAAAGAVATFSCTFGTITYSAPNFTVPN